MSVIVADGIQNNLLLVTEVLSTFHIHLHLFTKEVTSCEFTYSYNKEIINAIDENHHINNLLEQFKDLFEERVGLTPKYKFKIKCKQQPPRFHKKPFRIPVAHQQEIKEQIDKLIKQNIIKKQTSSYTSSAFTVPKPDGTNRMVVDYSKTLNKWIERHYFHIPTIDDLLYHIVALMIFTKLDCRSGFSHIGLDEESQQYTAFSLPWGTYIWNRMPMGIATTPEAFQEFMNSILGHLPSINNRLLAMVS